MLVQKQLADVGIDMTLLPLKQAEIERRLGSGDFDAFLWEMYGRSVSSVYDFWHSHPIARANTGYTGADAVLDRIRAAKSDDDLRAGVAEFSRRAARRPAGGVYRLARDGHGPSRPRFDVAPEPNRDILSNIWQWQLAAANRKQIPR